jgi:uncharacterized protein (DUF58 family)
MAAVLILLACMLLVGVLRGQAALIMLASLLLLTTLGSDLWSRRATRGLSYRRSFDPPRIFPGEETDYVVEIVNQKLLPLPWLRLDEHMPAAIVPVQGEAPDGPPGPRPGSRGLVTAEEGWQRRRSVSLGWRERLILRQRFTCARRGEYVVGPTDIETGDPLGIFPVHQRVPESRPLLVYPRVAALGPSPLPSRFPFGSASARPPALEDPLHFAGVRDYRVGDPMRWIDWKASARRMQLQTRVFAPTTLNTVVVALNAQTMAYAWQGYDLHKLEEAIGVAAALVRDALAKRHLVGLAANAAAAGTEEFQIFLRPNRRPSQLEDILAALARLAPIPTLSFGGLLQRIAASFPYGASLVAVTAFLDEPTADDLAALAARGHAVALFFLGDQLPVAVDPAIATTVLPSVTFEVGLGADAW